MCFSGTVTRYRHESKSTKTTMGFSVFMPKNPEKKPLPVLYWLSGLTCDDTNMMIKAGAQRHLAEHDIVLVCPDTSPRGLSLPGEADHWDFGRGAGFYLDAVVPPFNTNYNMYSYIAKELPAVIETNFSVDPKRKSIFGHSMGGLGALNIYLHNREQYLSVSAFSPICNPVKCLWGQKAFRGYLGPNEADWAPWDPSLQLAALPDADVPRMLVSQGTRDEFLTTQLKPESLRKHQNIRLVMHEGYDHSYYFIATFMRMHVAHHAARLNTA